MHFLYRTLVLLFAVFNISYGQYYGASSTNKCRCFTSDPCFPGSEELNSFNVSVSGRLMVPHPTGWECYPSNLNETFCNMLKANSSDGFFRSTIPGSMQEVNWEEEGMQRCPLERANIAGAQCQQGRVPIYGVDARSVADIQNTLKFAAQYNLRLSIKNTGHEYLGRSATPGSLLLWLHNIGEIKVDMSFQQQNCSKSGPAVTVSGGVHWREVYAAVSNATNDQYVVVGGMCPSVGAAGGYPLAGGHSPLSPLFGLAVDNVLQYDLVTADGVLRTVNDCQDPDLFWALRGGGPATFGIVTSVTYQLQPSPKDWTSFQIVVSPVAGLLLTSQVQQLYTILMEHIGSMDDAQWGGYFEINPLVGLAVTFIIPQTESVANQTILPFITAFQQMEQNGIVRVSPSIKSQPSFFAWKSNHVYPATDIDATGKRLGLGTRLIPKDALQDPKGLAATLYKGGALVDDFIGLLVPGKGVRDKDPNSQTTSVTPGWRKAFLHCGFLVGWNYDTADSVINTKVASIQTALDVLRKAFPDSGAYFNEANIEPNFQQTFWGDANYVRLLKIKKQVDPDGLLYCKQCVGSEEWDSVGKCRLY